jgi:hypothetical protein
MPEIATNTLSVKLGQRVSFKAHVRSQYSSRDDCKRRRIEKIELTEPETGIVVGVRTLREGVTVLESDCDDMGYHYAEWWEFRPSRYIKVYLVATNLTTIRRVLPEDILEAEGE